MKRLQGLLRRGAVSGYWVLLLPACAWADNCGSLRDCYNTVAAAAAAAASLAAGIGLLSLLGSLEETSASAVGNAFKDFSWGAVNGWGAAKAAFGVIVNGLGLVAGLAAFFMPVPVFAQVLGGMVAAKSVAGLVLNGVNLWNSVFHPQEPVGPGSASEWMAEKVAPGNAKVGGVLVASEMGLDLSYSLGIAHAIEGGLGIVRSKTFGAALERVHIDNLSDLGKSASVFAGADILNNGYTQIRTILKANAGSSSSKK